ncbi:TetR/AcrR family transcriptional regulator [Paenibacillus pinistramenti]|uniref:TetR/AcrR family transcriptional regulator n=1 Tax=Paenibacillus pinistramenti TaxID=1768003 RepID=UPI00110932BA|nr:TetR/AcrR family transcriptional regulator [Paenibacillus pinistramenti]
MSTTRSEQAAETREKLLEAAKSLFAEKGFDGTPVRLINRSIQMGDGILYHYFPGGKREILTVLIRESFDRRREAIGQTNRTVEHLDLREALLTFTRKLFDLFMVDLDLMKILFRENDVLGLEESQRLASWLQEQFAIFADFLDRRRLKGEVKADLDVTLAARQFLTMVMQIGISRITGIEIINEPDVDRYFERVVDFTIGLWKIS